MPRAVIWDVDGTLAETERDGHRVAFNAAFEDLAVPWRWDVPTYGVLLRTAGGYERLLRFLATCADAPVDEVARSALAADIHRSKNEHYERVVRDGAIPLRPGVARMLEACVAAGVVVAIATTSGRRNVDALLTAHLGPAWNERFGAVVCAEDAALKKPDPSAYRLVCERLAIMPSEALAIEDSPNGLAATKACGIATLITRSAYFAGDDFSGAAAICDDLDHPVAWKRGGADRVDLNLLGTMMG